MQKLMKNWVFTLITCILLAILSVLMFLSGFEVAGIRIGRNIIHIVAGVALALYTVFALFPLVARYRGALQGFVLGEVIILLVTAAAHLCMEFFAIPLLSDLQVCSVLGLALWLRGVVETVHAYLSASDADVKKRIPLWKLLCYILLSAVGVWQLVKPLVSDSVFIFVIGAISGVMGLIFAYATAANRKATADVRAAKKAAKMAAKRAKKEEAEAQKLVAAQAAAELAAAQAAAEQAIAPAPEQALVEEQPAAPQVEEQPAPAQTEESAEVLALPEASQE